MFVCMIPVSAVNLSAPPVLLGSITELKKQIPQISVLNIIIYCLYISGVFFFFITCGYF